MRHRREETPGLFDGELQTTAMIDVIFILLIFFVSVSRLKESRLDLRLPDVSARASEPVSPEAVLLLEIGADGSVVLDGSLLSSPQALARALAAYRGDPLTSTVQLRGDRDARHGDIAAALATLQQSGFHNVRFAVQ